MEFSVGTRPASRSRPETASGSAPPGCGRKDSRLLPAHRDRERQGIVAAARACRNDSGCRRAACATDTSLAFCATKRPISRRDDCADKRPIVAVASCVARMWMQSSSPYQSADRHLRWSECPDTRPSPESQTGLAVSDEGAKKKGKALYLIILELVNEKTINLRLSSWQ
jgi:hypothetical protein